MPQKPLFHMLNRPALTGYHIIFAITIYEFKYEALKHKKLNSE